MVTKSFVRVAHVDEIPPGTGKHVEVGEHVLAVFNHEGRFFVLDGTCPHQGGPLGEGYLDEEGVVTCPWHGWQFRVSDGASPLSDALRARTYEVEVRDGQVFAAVETDNE